ncbi:uncharacterized protein MELLADRAFT_48043 [Melampsora larici-populina 98AG31]|uniref:Uncharacterized protein n=1 Tax=Melampsora larici-populina (strain 98AG31 / pathotype 3-4-7) TaxID=747676 RepID=F4RJ55_MELLP|nr:uncharacterized protein MELLADRAFT_48043 [Melampsora larici-populina 98AG31]EGG07712.1 hypothetical protein MELLADRAFT_48043 [Melampsora larici-populina 98AG31]
MSVPATVKDVSENPSAKAVTNPTDKVFKSKDEERKMRFYGIIEAFRAGKYPSNAQIDETLTYATTHSPVDESKLSSDGRQLIQDFRDIIETARVMVQKKNADELMQNFLYHTRHVDGESHIQKLKDASNSAPNKEEAKNDGQAAAEHLRTLAKLIYTSSETRKLLKDIGILARDVVADAAVKVAENTRPGEEELRQVDEAAPADEWVGPDGSKRSRHDKAPSTGLSEKAEEAKRVASKAQDETSKVASKANSEVEDVSSTAQSHAKDASSQVQDTADGTSGSNNREQASATANEGKKIPEEHKEKARKAKEDTKEYIQDKFPKERRDRFIYRLKKVIVEQQRHRDYQEAIDFFLGMAESYQGHAKGVTSSAANKGGDVLHDPAFKQAQKELRTLLERFANGASLQPVFDAINQIYVDAQNDPELKAWFQTVDKYIRRVLQEPGYVMKDSCDQTGREINESGKKFWEHKYAHHWQTLFDEIESFFTQYAEDPLNTRFGACWKKLTKDLFLNSEGSLTLKTHLWEDITSVILPSLLKHIGYIPIPRIEYTDQQLDLVIENLTLEGQNLLPNTVELEMRNYFKLSAYEKIANANKHSFWISFSQIQADLRDVAFYVHKKSGFPKIKDSGLADVVISGNGVSGKVHIESSTAKDRVFTVKEVKVKVDKLSFGIRDTKHNFLYSTLRPLAQSLVKKQIAKAIEDGIRSGLGQLDAQFVDIKERLDDAEGDDQITKMDVIKDTFTSKKDDASAQINDKKEKTGTFKLVGKRESKIIDWASKNSLVEKQGAKMDAIATQDGQPGVDGWKTDAFTIINAN